MSTTVKDETPASRPNASTRSEAVVGSSKGGNYKGFVAGVFSGIAKLSVGYVYMLTNDIKNALTPI
jgi:solute carrier family 25 (mitochondrial carnitine/acylcarnitine transporter), member 20/29